MNSVAQWIGYAVMALGSAAVMAGVAWLVVELLWKQAQRVKGFDTLVRGVRYMGQHERLIADHERYLWLAERLIAADFAWGDPPRPVLVFEWPGHVPVGGSCDANIDAAIANQKMCDELCASDNHICGRADAATSTREPFNLNPPPVYDDHYAATQATFAAAASSPSPEQQDRGLRACGHLAGGCEQCHQCLLDAGETRCPTCEPDSDAAPEQQGSGNTDGVPQRVAGAQEGGNSE